jgi:leucine dehydrogenase
MEYISLETKHCTGLPESFGGGGDPSPVTAYGVYLGMKASAKEVYGKDDLKGKKILVQGVGKVGQTLVDYLIKEEAIVYIFDINADNVKLVTSKHKVTVVDALTMFDLDIDIYAPCALGATINDDSVYKIKASIVAGAANNQLADENKHGKILQERGILYAPDFLINAGGIINVYAEIEKYDKAESLRRTENIYNTTLEIFDYAVKHNITTHAAALTFAQNRINQRKKEMQK